MTAYSQLAPHSDILGWADFTSRLWPHVSRFLNLLDKQPSSFLDIACGTGMLASLMTERGISVIGIDKCEQMINVAKSKSFALRPAFHVADMCDFDLGETFPLTGCFYDALNHLSSGRDLQLAFNCASRHTSDTGYYIFDILTERGLRDWEPYFSMERNRFIVSQRGRYNSRTKTRTIRIEAFVRNLHKKTEFIEELLVERAFPVAFVQQALARAGFKRIAFSPFDSDETIDNASRLFVICRK